MLQAASIVLSIFLMIALGMILTQIGLFKAEHTQLLSRLVVQVALPGMIVSNLFGQFTRESLLASAAGIAAPFLSIALTGAVAWLLARLIRLDVKRRGAFLCMFTFSNSVFIGLPVSLALFGEAAVPYTLLYYIANTVLFWSAGHALLRKDGAAGGAFNWKKLVPFPLAVFFACAMLLLLGLRLPAFVLDAAKYVGSLVTPLSLFFTGILLMDMRKSRRLRWQRGYALVLLGRFLVGPALFLLFSALFPMPDLMRGALLIQSAMPVMSQTPIVAENCGADAGYAAGGVAVTTACSLLFIPLYMAFL